MSKGSKPTILYVEDEPMVRALGVRILNQDAYTVMVAENGQAGLKAFSSHSGMIDLVITDVKMPVMNGPEMVVELRKKAPDIKVIFVSGFTTGEDEEKMLMEDHTYFLQKPYSASALREMVNAILTD